MVGQLFVRWWADHEIDVTADHKIPFLRQIVIIAGVSRERFGVMYYLIIISSSHTVCCYLILREVFNTDLSGFSSCPDNKSRKLLSEEICLQGLGFSSVGKQHWMLDTSVRCSWQINQLEWRKFSLDGMASDKRTNCKYCGLSRYRGLCRFSCSHVRFASRFASSGLRLNCPSTSLAWLVTTSFAGFPGCTANIELSFSPSSSSS